MTYQREIPRDLFNEANLLKCYGRLWICLEDMGQDGLLVYDGDQFIVHQNETSGGIYIRNIMLVFKGKVFHLERPLNSREPYPLYLTIDDDNEIAVFNDDGYFTDDMLRLIHSWIESPCECG